ncbi:hydroxymethylbilane synthase [Melghirimyces profundicolus]|uniref:Porphobilinogen deaminase n=1 Tax=Melghirimyces profundicolus TaxID=1242148 RepID=A0A2T6BTG9_9BACL|nr:hydroxymethylbilane synthase [Melghirimyces profundicolus]PTX59372.1 hydroxymethylbilane synthase [Melghirimyces profundicolus]
MRTVIVGTRRSELAVTQTQWVLNRLKGNMPEGWECKQEKIMTRGDRILNVTLSKVGGKGLFVKEIEQALLDGRIDLAVHSMKDMPADMPKGLTMGAVTLREDPRDCLLSREGLTLKELPENAIVGTSSLRRQAQILAFRPDLRVKPVRGNLNTRYKKLMDGQFDAIVLAYAGIERMGWQEKVTEILPEDVMLPAVGQGALAVQCRAGDQEMMNVLQAINDPVTEQTVTAERAFLHAYDGGCHLPIAGYATLEGDRVRLRGLVAHPSGHPVIRGEREGKDPGETGRRLAEELRDRGAKELLEEVRERTEP